MEEICSEVVGMVPSYSHTGDGCRLFCRTAGDEFYSLMESHPVESVKRQLARCYAIDLSAQSLLLRRDYHRSPPLPFYLYDGRIFIPLKLRLPRIAGDSCYGYIELEMISRILPADDGHCRIIFTNGQSLPVFSQISTARLALYFGVEIQKNVFSDLNPDREILQALRTLRRYFGNKQTC
jgi:hypothetical protein